MSDGNSDIVEKGFCYTTVAGEAPTLADARVIATSGGDDISATLTGLAHNTTYYIRAYATNDLFTGYSGVIEVTTELNENAPGIGDNVSPDM